MAEKTRLHCPKCGAEMNHHADKIDYSAGRAEPQADDLGMGGVLQEVHTCPNCGNVELRRAAAREAS
jgi:predicted RNA-binding Zn-ribbon protein involved in translation (DUF1610 family)